MSRRRLRDHLAGLSPWYHRYTAGWLVITSTFWYGISTVDDDWWWVVPLVIVNMLGTLTWAKICNVWEDWDLRLRDDPAYSAEAADR